MEKAERRQTEMKVKNNHFSKTVIDKRRKERKRTRENVMKTYLPETVRKGKKKERETKYR